MRAFMNGEAMLDEWRIAGDGETLPPAGPVIVPLAALARALESGRPREEIGVLIDGDDDIDALQAEIESLPLIAIAFPAFTDGRGYSIARRLRLRGYRGDVRAVGEILSDQVLFLERCGFSSLALAADADPAQFRRALGAFSFVYQPAADCREAVTRLRERPQ